MSQKETIAKQLSNKKKAMKMANIYIVDDAQGFNQEETMIQIVKEISAIQQTIRSNFNASNVINFTNYVGKKMK